jgi:hypothetical protein
MGDHLVEAIEMGLMPKLTKGEIEDYVAAVEFEAVNRWLRKEIAPLLQEQIAAVRALQEQVERMTKKTKWWHVFTRG